MPVPFIDLKRFEPNFMDQWMEKAKEVSINTAFVGGPFVDEFEEKAKKMTGAKNAVGCANGTDALQLGLRALGVGTGDLVLIPDATFWATFESVVNVGARPVTVDIDMNDLQMDFDLFCEAAEKYKPKAAILVHLYGWGSAKIEKFRRYCKDNGIALLEDGAQAWGVEYNGNSLIETADMITCSFYPAKVLGACGDAGAVFCQKEEDAKVVRQLGNHGRTTHYEHGLLGFNSRMAGFDAAYLSLSMDYIDQRIESRRTVANSYYDELEKLNVKFIKPPEGYKETGYLNVTLHDVEVRDQILAVLKENGIGYGTVYPGAMSRQSGAEGYLHAHVGGNNADLLGRGIINLPLYAYMKQEEVAEVINVFGIALEKTGAASSV